MAMETSAMDDGADDT